jgi:hypothetical protein
MLPTEANSFHSDPWTPERSVARMTLRLQHDETLVAKDTSSMLQLE